LSGIPVAITVIFGAEWLLRIRRTIPAANLNTRFGDLALRVAQAAAVHYAVMTIVFWHARAEWLIYHLGTASGVLQRLFLSLRLPFFIAVALIGWVAILTLNRKPDRPERVRLVALALAVPFLACGFVVRPEVAAYGTVIGLMIFLVGALEYHVAQG